MYFNDILISERTKYIFSDLQAFHVLKQKAFVFNFAIKFRIFIYIRIVITIIIPENEYGSPENQPRFDLVQNGSKRITREQHRHKEWIGQRLLPPIRIK